jgi:lipoate-protein ligase B
VGEDGTRSRRVVWSPEPVPLNEAQRRQDEWAEEIAAGADDVLWLLRHPPTITIGRSGDESDICAEREVLAERGVAVHHVRRGGQVTFHGPAQLIGYPLLDLQRHRQDIHWYLRALEEALIRALAGLGIEATRRGGLTGVWVEEQKIASIGVRVRRWITGDGFALNVGADLSGFGLIRPCGMDGATMTSVSRLLGRDFEPEELVEPTTAAFDEVLERQGTGDR